MKIQQFKNNRNMFEIILSEIELKSPHKVSHWKTNHEVHEKHAKSTQCLLTEDNKKKFED